jgi:hypothetical protein
MADKDPCKDATFPLICRGIEAVREAVGSPTWPGPDFSSDPRLKEVEVRLTSEPDAPLSQRALLIAEALRQIGEPATAVLISEAIPQIIASSETANAELLGRAIVIKARSLDKLGKSAEADSAFAIAEHFHTLAGRIQRVR